MRKQLIILLFLFIPIVIYSRTIEEIKRSGYIYAAFTEASYNSINRDIAEEFAKFLNVELKIIYATWEENFMENGKKHDDLEDNPDYYYTPDALKKADFIYRP